MTLQNMFETEFNDDVEISIYDEISDKIIFKGEAKKLCVNPYSLQGIKDIPYYREIKLIDQYNECLLITI